MYIPALVSFLEKGGMFVLGTHRVALLPLHGRVRWGTGAGHRDTARKEKFTPPAPAKCNFKAPEAPLAHSLPLGAPSTTGKAEAWTQLLPSSPAGARWAPKE